MWANVREVREGVLSPEVQLVHCFLHLGEELAHGSQLVLRLLTVWLQMTHVIIQPADYLVSCLFWNITQEVNDGGAHLPDRLRPIQLWGS